jgi:peptide deformylase
LIQAHGSSIYRSKAENVGATDGLKELISRLKEVQRELKHPLVSAKHLGLNLSLFSVDLNYANRDKEDFATIFINGKVVSTQAPLVSGLEDDLSIPRLSVSIERPKQIEVSFLDEEFKEQTTVFSDLAARWIHHGIDQLNGISIVDRLNTHRKQSVKGHLRRISEQKIETNYKLQYDNLNGTR